MAACYDNDVNDVTAPWMYSLLPSLLQPVMHLRLSYPIQKKLVYSLSRLHSAYFYSILRTQRELRIRVNQEVNDIA